MRMRTAGWPRRMRRAGLALPSSPGALRVVAVVVVMVTAGVTAGSASAAGQQASGLRLGYVCAFPSASRPVRTPVSARSPSASWPVRALVTATFPAAGTAGRPIRPTGTGIAVTLPRAAVADLARLNATAVTLTASLSTRVTEGTRSATALWRDFRSPAAAIPRSGPLTFTASGTAPPVTAAAGEVAVNAGGLSLLFTALTANVHLASPSDGNSRGASPSSVQVACIPRASQDTTLARIAVARPASARRAASPGDDPKHCRPYPKHLKLNPRFPLPTPPPHPTIIRHPQRACSYAAGYTNARKLKQAAIVGPGLTDLKLGDPTILKNTPQYGYIQQRVPSQLEFHGRPVLPPARATLLAFGFVPVSATLQISEIGSLNAALISCSLNKPKAKCPNPPPVTEALFFGLVTLRISHVAVNGVPLNVGPHCQTASPFTLKLVGVPPFFSTFTLSGLLTGEVTIPKFKGCHNGGDNLDPVFDATVSGPGNFVKINQGTFCSPDLKPPTNCPPPRVKPVH